MKRTERILITLVVVAVCVWFLFPTIKWYAFVSPEDKALALGTNVQIREYSTGQAAKILRELKSSGEDVLPGKEYSFLSPLSSFESEQDFLDAVEGHYRDYLLGLKKTSQKALQLGLDLRGGMSILLDVDTATFEEKLGRKATEAEISEAIEQDVEILKNRIDQFGVSEPEIRKQGTEQILIELAGSPDPERVDTFLKGKGSLTFNLVDPAMTEKAIKHYQENPSLLYDDYGQINQPSFLPKTMLLTGLYKTDEYGLDSLESLVVIVKEEVLDGSHIKNVQTAQDGISGQPVVTFKLDDEGGDIFYAFTKAHINDPLAIIMDGKAKSVASIGAALRTDIQISGFSAEEAEDLAIVLKTASLPIPVEVANQQTVGASLGKDAVAIGVKAIIIGFALVVLFMFLFYSWAGLVADIALIFNLVIMVATLGGFGSTLTLTGIAGLILTLGMAVDSNVIIYERIKEELAIGKKATEAVTIGFSKALWTILDSNITTIIAAIVLIQFGSSTVKGFASTLAIGIVSSLFTSLFLSHLILDLTVKKKILISWKKKKEVLHV